MTDPYNRPSDPAKRRSAALTDGPERAPARDAEGDRAHRRRPRPAADRRRHHVDRDDAVQLQPACPACEDRGAGGTPMEFNTISLRRRLDGD